MITLDDFRKVELKIAKIVEVDEIPGKDKLYKLQIALGSEKRTIVAGIRESYSKADLLGRNIIVIANLEPATIAGTKSEAMLLAAKDVNGKYRILTIDGDANAGTMVV